MATTRLSKTFSSAGNRRTFTLSTWIKRSKIGSAQTFGMYKNEGAGGGNNYLYVGYFNSSDRLYLARNQSATEVEVITSRMFRDINAWYHIVIAVDTTQGTASNRVKCWVNGVQETSFHASTYPSQNQEFDFNVAQIHYIGAMYNGTSDNFDGIISHMHFCDGYSYQASDFGSTDSTTGEWKIKTNVSVSYGTNGFFIFKDGTNLSGSTVQDQSGQGNDWTVAGGTLTKSEDNPSNIFCTGNRISNCYGSNLSYSNGNNTLTGGSGWQMGSATLGASSGKYYWEYKMTTLGTGGGYHKIGFISDQAFDTSAGHNAVSGLDGGYAFYINNGNLEVRTDGAVISGYATGDLSVSFSNNDIMCVAVDMTNKRAYCRKNDGAWIKSADPVNGTNGLDISSDYPTGSTKAMIPAFSIYESGAGSLNFGNGYFGTTAVSSAGTNASGIGIFEYDVPTGYTALSTKGLNE